MAIGALVALVVLAWIMSTSSEFCHASAMASDGLLPRWSGWMASGGLSPRCRLGAASTLSGTRAVFGSESPRVFCRFDAASTLWSGTCAVFGSERRVFFGDICMRVF